MKKPTTPFGIQVHHRIQINREFLLSQGWKLEEEKPLYERFTHSRNGLLRCTIGFYGDFAISEMHWCNGYPERSFFTINPYITKEDYFKILSLLKITI